MRDTSEKEAVMSSRQAAELDHAFERNHWTKEDVKVLSMGDALRRVLLVARGQGKVIQTVGPLIDCSRPPFQPEGYKVVTHIKASNMRWDPARIKELPAVSQKGDTITGHQLCQKLEGAPVLNTCILDCLLHNPEFAPEEWKDGRQRHFFGTIYQDQTYSRLSVCRMFVSEFPNYVDWGTTDLDDSFDANDLILLAA